MAGGVCSYVPGQRCVLLGPRVGPVMQCNCHEQQRSGAHQQPHGRATAVAWHGMNGSVRDQCNIMHVYLGTGERGTGMARRNWGLSGAGLAGSLDPAVLLTQAQYNHLTGRSSLWGRVRTAPIIMLFIPGTPLKTTHLQKDAQSISLHIAPG